MYQDGEAKQTVDARDVLDVNAQVRRGFVGLVRGYYRRVGPNAWDDYEYIDAPGDELDVYPGVKIQLEPGGCSFRMRSQGKVWRVSWQAESSQAEPVAGDPSVARELFLSRYVAAFDEKPGYGAAAVIADKLK